MSANVFGTRCEWSKATSFFTGAAEAASNTASRRARQMADMCFGSVKKVPSGLR